MYIITVRLHTSKKGVLYEFGRLFWLSWADSLQIAMDHCLCDSVVAHQGSNERFLPAPILQFRNLLPR